MVSRFFCPKAGGGEELPVRCQSHIHAISSESLLKKYLL